MGHRLTCGLSHCHLRGAHGGVTGEAGHDPGSVREMLTLRLFMFAGILIWSAPLQSFFLRGLALQWWTFTAGWVFSLASFAIRRRAIAALGKFWSLHVEIRENHQFVAPAVPLGSPSDLFFDDPGVARTGVNHERGLFLACRVCLFCAGAALRLKLEETALVEKFGTRTGSINELLQRCFHLSFRERNEL